MADIPSLLLASLVPSTRKQAEQALQAHSKQAGFLPGLLQLVLASGQERSVRLAGSVFLKNTTKSRWDDVCTYAFFSFWDLIVLPQEEASIIEADKVALRRNLVPAMIALSSPSDKTIRSQVAETISVVASYDFPDKWTDLIDVLVSSLSHTNFSINVGVLQTAHSIFHPWRSATRSDTLFTTINYVLSRTDPNSSLAMIAQAQVNLVEVYYDLTCQDLPPDFEDTHQQFFGASNGLFLQLLSWDPQELRGDPDDTTPSLPSQIKTGILEIGELFVKLYPETLQTSSSVEGIVRIVWELVGGGKLPEISNDALVSQSLRFVSTAIRSGHYKQLFGSKDTISNLIQGVVVPNIGLRDHEIEQFEDDPLEYIRLDLAVPTGSGSLGLGSHDVVTRRQAAADIVRALVGSGYEAETTEVAGRWIGEGLQGYASNKTRDGSWKAKDAAVYLLTAVATRGSTMQHGVTSTNPLIDVVKFFSENIYEDLRADPHTIHPLLQVDAIRYLYTFRSQLSKEQLISVFPLLAQHLTSPNYVCYTYAAISIERILARKAGAQLMFSQSDVQETAPQLIDRLLTKLEEARSPEKVAENDYLIKCVFRLIVTARASLYPQSRSIMERLVGILGVISRNPSNPNFDQYIFESISALIRYSVGADKSALSIFEQALFGPFTIILQQDIDRGFILIIPSDIVNVITEYIPYVFQVLGQMLEFHSTDVPVSYRDLLPFLLTPAGWQQKGSIPGLVKLLKAFLASDAQHMVATGQFAAVLAVIQQRLIPSKLNDSWGFELLQSVVQHIPMDNLKGYLRATFITLLTRMQTSKTDSYVNNFTHFLLFSLAIQKPGLTPDHLISIFEDIQIQLWSQVLSSFIIPALPRIPVKDRKVAVVGLNALLTQSNAMIQGPLLNLWLQCFAALPELLAQPQYLMTEKNDVESGNTLIDFEEQNTGYQAAYSRLAASESESLDPVSFVENPVAALSQSIKELIQKRPEIREIVIRTSDTKSLYQSLL
ncbi:hypothetical protein NLI96_g338 [Meripilus lineatus]|uniref:Importin N-terminal domain-containing protein n=1 Tax=Meripilus lineatus TaxID=2056292 RepID=A0AAD5VE34_9APHY|nr:hypothetical protein NLI96_g338 [Physisporinus lineatus]